MIGKVAQWSGLGPISVDAKSYIDIKYYNTIIIYIYIHILIYQLLFSPERKEVLAVSL